MRNIKYYLFVFTLATSTIFTACGRTSASTDSMNELNVNSIAEEATTENTLDSNNDDSSFVVSTKQLDISAVTSLDDSSSSDSTATTTSTIKTIIPPTTTTRKKSNDSQNNNPGNNGNQNSNNNDNNQNNNSEYTETYTIEIPAPAPAPDPEPQQTQAPQPSGPDTPVTTKKTKPAKTTPKKTEAPKTEAPKPEPPAVKDYPMSISEMEAYAKSYFDSTNNGKFYWDYEATIYNTGWGCPGHITKDYSIEEAKQRIRGQVDAIYADCGYGKGYPDEYFPVRIYFQEEFDDFPEGEIRVYGLFNN